MITKTQTEKKVTRSEWFAGAAFVVSAASLVFTGGVVYGQVQRNADDITELKEKVDPALNDIASMKTSIDFLVAAERERQSRAARR